MARPALATLDDLARLLTVTDEDLAEARLEQASELVRAYAGIDWLNEDESDVDGVPGAIPGLVASMVERATRNPDGVTSESAGPFARSFGSDAAARIYLTSADKLVIRHAATASPIGVISTTRGAMETADVIDFWGDLVEAENPYALWP